MKARIVNLLMYLPLTLALFPLLMIITSPHSSGQNPSRAGILPKDKKAIIGKQICPIKTCVQFWNDKTTTSCNKSYSEGPKLEKDEDFIFGTFMANKKGCLCACDFGSFYKPTYEGF